MGIALAFTLLRSPRSLVNLRRPIRVFALFLRLSSRSGNPAQVLTRGAVLVLRAVPGPVTPMHALKAGEKVSKSVLDTLYSV